MGILNATPDSFYSGSRNPDPDVALALAMRMQAEGADILDIGGMSSRPGAEIITPEEEIGRVIPVIERIAASMPEMLLSIDTVHGKVADAAIQAGVHIINDISCGSIDPGILEVTASAGLPYVLMHMPGTPATMQSLAQYDDVSEAVYRFLAEKTWQLHNMGITQIIADPGFGFGKTLTHNYQLLRAFETFQSLQLPLMAGVSRKQMISRLLDTTTENALNGTTAAHMILCMKGANILRVHDVGAAAEARTVFLAANGIFPENK